MKSKRAKNASSKKSLKKKKGSSKIRAKKKIKTAAGPKRDLRQFKRYPQKNLWVTEYSSDYFYTLQATNLSEGGVFLKGSLKGKGPSSLLNINLGRNYKLTVEAVPVRDHVSEKECGTGYAFMGLSKDQSKALRSFLRGNSL